MNNTSQIKITNTIDLLSLITQTPVSLVTSNGETLYCPTVEDHHYLNADMARFLLSKFEQKNLPDNSPYIHLYSLSVLQGIVRLSESEYIFVGPVCITHISLDNSIEAFRSITSYEDTHRLHDLLKKFEPIDFFRFAGILATISNSYSNTDFSPSDIINNNFIENIKVGPFDQISYENASMIPIDSLNFFQNSLFSIISSGNMDALIKHWQDNLINTLIKLKIQDEDINYLCITFYPYMFQGAVNGGANIHVCFEKYIDQIRRFKQCKNIIECMSELKRSSYEYCNLVKDTSTLDFMPDVCNLCVSYINDHIQEKITVDDLTHLTGIHRNKLYSIFRANFGMTVSEYIEKERLRRAVIYLESSHYTISEIASTMGYANQSHFITIFKKNYGCTPTQYLKDRSQNKRPSV